MIELSSIRDAAILDGLTQSEIQEIADIAREVHVEKGERLFSRGNESDTFYIVNAGRFALTIELRVFDGHEEMAVEEKVPGDSLGWSALVAPFDAIYSAYCMLDGSVVALPRGDLEDLLAADTHLGHRFARNLNQLIGSRIRALQDLWVKEVEQSRARVDYWTHTRLSGDLHAAIESAPEHHHWRRLTPH